MMGYRIEYGPGRPARRRTQTGTLRLRILTAVFLLLFTLGVKHRWPEGQEQLQHYLLPDSSASVTQQAFSSLVSDLQSGIPLSDSVTAFCQEVIDHADAAG